MIDSRDTRIAELETALRLIHTHVAKHNPLSLQDVLIMRIAKSALATTEPTDDEKPE